MWFLKAPASVAGLVAIALLPSIAAKPYPVHIEELRDLHNASQLERRQCAGTSCGWYGQLCCTGGETCITDANNQAQCAPASGGQITQGGSWQTFTTTWVETGLVTRTSVWSTYVGATAAATPAACGGSQSPCGTVCCDSGYWCFNEAQNQCRIIGGSSSPGISATGTPTATLPFSTPIATGVNGTLLPSEGGGGGLSGGAIAGIVIGVIAGIFLLFLICMYCCAKTAFDAIAAIFGFGKKRRHTHEETTYVESHHHGSSGGGRRWYGQPSRPGRPKKDGGMFGGALGMGALLGGLALALGLKRRHDRKHDDKSTTISGSSAYYSDYTSSSSASSSDRRTRRSSRR